MIVEFAGYMGTHSSLRMGEILDLKLVKPKLADGMWLGERCVDEEQRQGFRRDMDSIYKELACTKTSKKIIRTNNTQKRLCMVASRVSIGRISTTATVLNM